MENRAERVGRDRAVGDSLGGAVAVAVIAPRQPPLGVAGRAHRHRRLQPPQLIVGVVHRAACLGCSCIVDDLGDLPVVASVLGVAVGQIQELGGVLSVLQAGQLQALGGVAEAGRHLVAVVEACHLVGGVVREPAGVVALIKLLRPIGLRWIDFLPMQTAILGIEGSQDRAREYLVWIERV